MTEREAIENLKGCVVSYEIDEHGRPNGNVTADLTMEIINLAISALEKQEQDRWIPCKERLPEEDEDVLVTVHFLGLKQAHPNGWNDHIKPSFYVDIAKHYSGEWCSASDEYKVARSRHIVTAWKPLPKPYTEEEQ